MEDLSKIHEKGGCKTSQQLIKTYFLMKITG